MNTDADDENRVFHSLYSAMGIVLLGVVGWIGSNVSHIPALEQKLDDYHSAEVASLLDHEQRIRSLEGKKQVVDFNAFAKPDDYTKVCNHVNFTTLPN